MRSAISFYTFLYPSGFQATKTHTLFFLLTITLLFLIMECMSNCFSCQIHENCILSVKCSNSYNNLLPWENPFTFNYFHLGVCINLTKFSHAQKKNPSVVNKVVWTFISEHWKRMHFIRIPFFHLFFFLFIGKTLSQFEKFPLI